MEGERWVMKADANGGSYRHRPRYRYTPDAASKLDGKTIFHCFIVADGVWKLDDRVYSLGGGRILVS
jgi:hypothetical protein